MAQIYDGELFLPNRNTAAAWYERSWGSPHWPRAARTLVVSCALMLAAARTAVQHTSADSAAIVALELQLTRLPEEGRVDEYASHLTADYARTSLRGTLEAREQAVAGWRRQGPSAAVHPTDLWVRVYGDAAVLTGVVSGADSMTPRTRITKTFIRQHGRWLLAAQHSSLIPREGS